MSRISETFQQLQAHGRTALMPYLTIGYPEKSSTTALVPAVIESGADMLELGAPFSDPLADGATIQESTQRALANGISLRYCFSTTRQLRQQGIETPFALMGYYNPIYQIGLDGFAAAAEEAGIDGVIVPDLPPEEAGGLDEALRRRGIDYIYLLAPTSDERRLRLVAAKARGFIYLVSLTGVTGVRSTVSEELPDFVKRVREATEDTIPLAVGFGISSPKTAREVGTLVEGVIVGSALIERISDPTTAETEARAFVRSLRDALDQGADS
ncbi:MAG: tryptophan synthase subunit alpha [Chloroflexota bacterium]|nr:tryptophan synthase subunit alpha [Chloroflexota bacterium]